MRGPRAFLCLILLGGLLSTALAVPENASGYSIYHVTVAEGGSGVEVDWWYRGPAVVVVHAYDAATGTLVASNYAWSQNRDAGVSARVSDERISMDLLGSQTLGWISGPVLDPGEYTILVLAFGNVIDLVVEPAEQGSQVEFRSEGPVRVVDQSEMTGPLAARATVGGATGYASIAGSYSFSVEHQLVGIFLQGPALISATTPTGALAGPDGSIACPCTVDQIAGAAARGPGSYTLDWTGASASALHVPLIAYADVDLSNS